MKLILSLILTTLSFNLYASSPSSRSLDALALAEVMHCEAGLEGRLGMLAVANVVLNRVKSPKFPNTILAVIKQPHQFECIQKGFKPSLKNAIHQKVISLAWEILDGTTPTITTATHYHTVAVNPYWSSRLSYLGQIGNHKFYKGY